MNSVETVTILITDLVGSTGLESRIGPGAADELRNEYFTLLRAPIEETGGRETKNTGDGLIAAFGSASAAVSCAVVMQQSFESRNRRSDEQLLIKIGISLGDATAADGDYFGMPVIEAARLCDRARGGQILAKEIVAHLAGGRDGHSFRSVGGLELKGIPEPLDTVEVAWEPLGEEAHSLPLPPLLQELPPGGFVGRSSERERLKELFEEVSEGSRRLALIAGEPGIGKTRLSTQTALEARADGAIVLYGRTDEEVAIPYGPWVQALTHYAEHCSESFLRAHVERHGGELARLVPAIKHHLADLPPPRDADPERERYFLFETICSFLSEASATAPLVLVLDDLHWADKPTVLLLRHVVSRGQGVRALVLATYRESDIGRGHPLTEVLAALHREQGVERFALKGLDEPDIAEIMERASGHELDEASRGLSHELHRETDGNPFYTGELLRHLRESGALYQEDGGRWTVRGELSQLGLPQSVRDVVARRIERLGDEARKALSVAAVIGREFDADVLLRITDHTEDELLELLEEAVDASVLTESPSVPGRFSFAHALINHTLYEGLGTTRRARLHKQIGEVMEQLYVDDPEPHVPELAYHFFQTTRGGDAEKAIDYSIRAAKSARSVFAWEDAAIHYQRALTLVEERRADQGMRASLLETLGDVMYVAGIDRARGIRYHEQALAVHEDLGDVARAAKLHGKLGVALGTFPDSLDVPAALTHLNAAEAVLVQVDPGPQLGHVYVSLASAALAGVRVEEGLAAARKAVDVAEALDDRGLWANAAGIYGVYLIENGRELTEGLELIGRAWEAADEVNDRWAAFATTWMAAVELAYWLGAPSECRDWCERELSKPRTFHAPIQRAFLSGFLATAQVLCGRLDEARATIDEVGGNEFAEPYLAFAAGDLDTASALWQNDLERSRRAGFRWNEARVSIWLGRLERARGDPRAAEALFEQGLAIGRGGPLPIAEIAAAAELAASYADTGQPEIARSHLERCRELSDGDEAWRGLGGRIELAAGTVAGAEGESSESDRHFQAAAESFGRCVLPFDQAEALAAWGRALERSGRELDAREKLNAAAAIYRGHAAAFDWAHEKELGST